MPVSIILVEPENADNIGAVCRAMKNMGLRDLRLVRPVRGWKAKGLKMAVSAGDVLSEAKLFKEVREAVSDCHLVFGTTRRSGPKRGQFLDFSKMIARVKKMSPKHQIGIMFGRESKGLDNESLGFCDWLVTIPVHPDYPSINLAQAVMITVFSIREKNWKLDPIPPKRGHYRWGQKEENEQRGQAPAFLNQEEILKTLDVFEKSLLSLGYGTEANKYLRIRQCLHRMMKRSGLLESEAQMFKGLSRRICERTEKAKSGK